MTKRDLAAGILCYSGMGLLQCRLERIFSRNHKIIIPAYHRIAEHNAEADYLDPELISATPEQFENQVKYLAKNYEVITFAQLSEVLEGKRELKRTPVIITLDDGYKDNFDIAWPILKKYGVPATIFITWDYIGQQKLFWWDYIYYLVQNTKVKNLKLAESGTLAIATNQEKSEAKNKIIALLKEVKNQHRIKILNKISEILNVPEPSDFRATLNWNEIHQMAEYGIEFGGHTLSHPILTELTDEDLQREIGKSKELLEGALKTEPVSFCYPVGQGHAVDRRIVAAVRQAGFKFATTACHGVNNLPSCDFLSLYRLRVSPQDNQIVFQERIHFPQVITY
ncbi:MAG: polysaccharide deacetylase family protein [Candidatus Schekmanbacteria bacterium]|nr:polysaccharide deacetylase family protein [Candidatus Schekmanbacteria bacterium]